MRFLFVLFWCGSKNMNEKDLAWVLLKEDTLEYF